MTEGKNYTLWTKQELLALPWRSDQDSVTTHHGFIIIPLNKKHDSGYPCMDVVAIDKDGVPFCRCAGYTDAIDLETTNSNASWRLWSIDVLPKSKLVHVWPTTKVKTASIGGAHSSLIITAD